MMHCVKKVGRTMACHDKGPQTCHAERQRSIHVGRTHQLVTPDASLPLSMTCPGAFFTACHDKVAGTCHSERSEESEVGHASRLVEPDASLPLILRFTQDDMSVGVCNGMLSEAKHLARHATPSMGNQMLRFTQHDIFAALTTRLIAALPGQAVDKLVKGFATIDTDA